MQTDTWLNETSYPDCCPLCSQPLYGSQKCPSCGFIAHEPARSSASPMLSSSSRTVARESISKQPHPITPIPARASALPTQLPVAHGAARPGLRRNMPDPQSDALPNWQMNNQPQSYESASYEAASSLPALSLIIADTPTAPPRSELQPRKTARLEAEQEQSIADMPTTPMRPEQRQQQSRKTARLEAEQEQIAEIDTLPPDLVAQITPRRMARAESHSSSENKRRSASGQSKPPVRTNRSVQPALAGIDEFDTLPPLNGTSVRPAETARELRTARTSRSASRQAFSSSQQSYRHVPAPRKGFHPLDSLRWWLLRPGHIEFLLWVTGSLLLFSITFFLLLATTLSVLMPNTASSGNLHNSSISSTATAQSTSGQSLTPQATHAQAQTPVSTPQAGSPGVRTTPVPGNTPALGNALNTTTDNSLIDRLLHLNPLIWLVAACYLLSLILLILAVRLRRRKSPSKIASENRVGR